MSESTLPVLLPPAVPNVVGQVIYWTELVDGSFDLHTRRAVVIEQDDGNGVHVLMTAEVDPQCRAEEEGVRLALALGTWRGVP